MKIKIGSPRTRLSKTEGLVILLGTSIVVGGIVRITKVIVSAGTKIPKETQDVVTETVKELESIIAKNDEAKGGQENDV